MIPWDIPTSDEEIPRLTHIYRNQHFTFLKIGFSRVHTG